MSGARRGCGGIGVGRSASRSDSRARASAVPWTATSATSGRAASALRAARDVPAGRLTSQAPSAGSASKSVAWASAGGRALRRDSRARVASRSKAATRLASAPEAGGVEAAVESRNSTNSVTRGESGVAALPAATRNSRRGNRHRMCTSAIIAAAVAPAYWQAAGRIMAAGLRVVAHAKAAAIARSPAARARISPAGRRSVDRPRARGLPRARVRA